MRLLITTKVVSIAFKAFVLVHSIVIVIIITIADVAIISLVGLEAEVLNCYGTILVTSLLLFTVIIVRLGRFDCVPLRATSLV